MGNSTFEEKLSTKKGLKRPKIGVMRKVINIIHKKKIYFRKEEKGVLSQHRGGMYGLILSICTNTYRIVDRFW